MRRNFTITLVTLSLFASALLRGQPEPQNGADGVPVQSTVPASSQPSGGVDRSEPKLVDFYADLMRPLTVGDSQVLNLIGNVVFYHNGAAITCDSAVRYSEKRMECFGNVLINQNTTYIYGDRADYDGEANIANVYSPLVKVVDEDAVMYTRNFRFNTLDNIGEYYGGGSLRQNENLMESDRGYYYVDTKDMIGVGNVQMKDSTYMLQSDSVTYNLDTEIARFYTKTFIWNEKGEILSADRGWYNHINGEYFFTENSYILTEEQEAWADTMDYRSADEHVLFLGNVQVRDDEQRSIAFGDYAERWGDIEKGLLTRNPSIMSWEEEGDTVYMRSDSIWVYTVNIYEQGDSSAFFPPGVENPASGMQESGRPLPAAASPVAREVRAREEAVYAGAMDTLIEQSPVHDDMPIVNADERAEPFDDDIPEDVISAYTNPWEGDAADPPIGSIPDTANVEDGMIGPVELTYEQRQQMEFNRRQQERLDSLDEGEAKITEATSAEEIFREENDELGLDPDVSAGATEQDSAEEYVPLPEGVAGDGEEIFPEPEIEDVPPDSVQRVVRAYNRVKIWRQDFQAVCDSLVAFTMDSTVHMYNEPIMWNEQNQITSEYVVAYTANEQLTKVVWSGGPPMMVGEVDSTRYNQLRGRTIEAHFRDNDIYRTDVINNVETYYYMIEDDTEDISAFIVVEAASANFHIEDRQMRRIVYNTEPQYIGYPMDKIPLDQPQFLPGFKWLPGQRPELKDVHNRLVRPSAREVFETMPQPQFPLTGQIDRQRQTLQEGRMWIERNDILSPLAQEFIRSVQNQ